MTANRRIFLNIVATYGRSLYALICGLFTARWVLMSLGEVNYGLLGVVGGLMAFIAFFNGLMSIAVGRYYAVAVGASQKEGSEAEGLAECRKWFNTAVSIHTIVPIVLMLVGYPIGVWSIENYLTIPADRVADCLWVFRFACVTCFIGMVNVPFTAMYNAKQYIAELTIYSFVTTTLNVIFLCYMISHPGEWLVRYSGWMMLLAIVPQLIINYRAHIVFPECKIVREYLFVWRRVKELFVYAFWQFVGMLGVLIRNQGFTILTNKFFGPAANAAMAIGNNVANHSDTLSNALTGAFAPAAMNSYGRGDHSMMLKMAYRSTKFGAVLFSIFLIPLAIELRDILTLWLKNPPAHTYEACLAMLTIVLIDQFGRGINIAIHSSGRVAAYNLIVGSLHILSLPIAWFVLRSTSLGFNGMLGVLVVAKALGIMIGAAIARKVAGYSLRHFFVRLGVPVLLTLLVSFSLGWLTRYSLQDIGIIRLPIVFAVGDSTLLLLTWMITLDSEEKTFCVDQIRKRLLKRDNNG